MIKCGEHVFSQKNIYSIKLIFIILELLFNIMVKRITQDEYRELQTIIELKDFKKAHEWLTKLLEDDPENVIFHLDMAYVEGQMNNLDAAQKHYEKVLEMAPSNPAGYAGLAHVYLARGDKQKAIEYFQKSLELDPSNGLVHLNLGDIYLEEDDYKSAKRHFLKAIQFGDEESENDIKHRIIQANIGLGDYKNAIFLGEQLIKKDPTFASVYNLLGVAYYLSGKFEKAINAFERYLIAVPDDEAARNILKKAKEKLKEE